MHSVNQVYLQRYACGVRNTRSPYRQVPELCTEAQSKNLPPLLAPHKSDNNGETMRGRGAVVARGQGRLATEETHDLTNTETTFALRNHRVEGGKVIHLVTLLWYSIARNQRARASMRDGDDGNHGGSEPRSRTLHKCASSASFPRPLPGFLRHNM